METVKWLLRFILHMKTIFQQEQSKFPWQSGLINHLDSSRVKKSSYVLNFASLIFKVIFERKRSIHDVAWRSNSLKPYIHDGNWKLSGTWAGGRGAAFSFFCATIIPHTKDFANISPPPRINQEANFPIFLRDSFLFLWLLDHFVP